MNIESFEDIEGRAGAIESVGHMSRSREAAQEISQLRSGWWVRRIVSVLKGRGNAPDHSAVPPGRMIRGAVFQTLRVWLISRCPFGTMRAWQDFTRNNRRFLCDGSFESPK